MGFPIPCFIRKEYVQLTIRKTWILCTLEMLWPKAAVLDMALPEFAGLEYTGRRKG